MPAVERIEDLRAQARHHRERYQLYRAKSYGPRATSPARLRELERASSLADSRLRHALDAASTAQSGPKEAER